MLAWLKRRSHHRHTARELYGAVVAQARQPPFYAVHGTPDTLDGRYEMIVLHLFLLLERLQREGEAGAVLSRTISETFIADTDTEMRELGVGDLAVPRKVKRAAAGLFERSAQYQRALDSAESVLLERFLDEVLGPTLAKTRPTGELADYVRRARRHLRSQASTALLEGTVTFPPIEPDRTGA